MCTKMYNCKHSTTLHVTLQTNTMSQGRVNFLLVLLLQLNTIGFAALLPNFAVDHQQGKGNNDRVDPEIYMDFVSFAFLLVC